MKKNLLKIILLSFLTLFLTNCEDGENGMDGTDATVDGTDGSNGVDGVDGADGLDFDDLLQYGAITVTIEGTDPEGNEFAETIEFNYTPVNGDYLLYGNIVEYDTEDNSIHYGIGRYLSVPDESINSTSTYLDLTVSNAGESNETYDFSIDIDGYAILYEGFDAFLFQDDFDTTDNIANLNISEYSFDQETNTLLFSSTFNVAPDDNTTGNDLAVTIEVNAVVFEAVEAPVTTTPL
ncbi:hypothetical protein [Aquimarina pacifica]|uniref:hypothetical protein n=1 Tax=Aquimarina pacifica TaxID=1296415 RepID=UPI0004712B95|nr:hypothetical protein [Aquimarina pacifica]